MIGSGSAVVFALSHSVSKGLSNQSVDVVAGQSQALGQQSTHLVTGEGRRYILDQSLDQLSDEISPEDFFRISRNCTVSIRAIGGISKHPSNRLKINLIPKPDFEAFVSRSRTTDFMTWLEGK